MALKYLGAHRLTDTARAGVLQFFLPQTANACGGETLHLAITSDVETTSRWQ
jgi:hypothetical protein